jgi:hypothetical protein
MPIDLSGLTPILGSGPGSFGPGKGFWQIHLRAQALDENILETQPVRVIASDGATADVTRLEDERCIAAQNQCEDVAEAIIAPTAGGGGFRSLVIPFTVGRSVSVGGVELQLRSTPVGDIADSGSFWVAIYSATNADFTPAASRVLIGVVGALSNHRIAGATNWHMVFVPVGGIGSVGVTIDLVAGTNYFLCLCANDPSVVENDPWNGTTDAVSVEARYHADVGTFHYRSTLEYPDLAGAYAARNNISLWYRIYEHAYMLEDVPISGGAAPLTAGDVATMRRVAGIHGQHEIIGSTSGARTSGRVSVGSGSGSGGGIPGVLLTPGSVAFAGADGILTEDVGFTYDAATDKLTAANIVASGLTATHLVFAGTGGLLSGEADLTWTAGTDTLYAKVFSSTQITDSGLTATHVLFAGTGGLLSGEADMTWVAGTDTFYAKNITGTTLLASGLTATRVVFVGAGGLLSDDAGFTYVAATDTASLGVLLLTAGTAAAPSLARQGYADDGMFWVGDGILGWTLGGVERMRLTAGTLGVFGASGAYAGTGVEHIFQVTTGTGVNTDEKLQFGIVDGAYAWIQAVKPGTSVRVLALQPGGGAGGVGIGTVTVPHGGIGQALLAIDGASASAYGPHIQLTTASDDYPALSFYPWAHGNVWIMFDCYYQGAWLSSNAAGNFRIRKDSVGLWIGYDTGKAAGAAVTFAFGVGLNVSGQWMLNAGTAALPCLTQYGYVDDGIYFPADGAVGVSLTAAERVRFTTSALYPITDDQIRLGAANLGWLALDLSDAVDTAASTEGEMRARGTQKGISVYIGGQEMLVSGKVYSLTADVTATTTSGTFAEADVASVSIPAAFLVAGNTITVFFDTYALLQGQESGGGHATENVILKCEATELCRNEIIVLDQTPIYKNSFWNRYVVHITVKSSTAVTVAVDHWQYNLEGPSGGFGAGEIAGTYGAIFSTGDITVSGAMLLALRWSVAAGNAAPAAQSSITIRQFTVTVGSA